MPLAANPLIQTPAAAASAVAAKASPPDVEPVRAGRDTFSKVYAKASDSSAHPVPRSESGHDKISGGARDVADSGKPLPVGKAHDTVQADQEGSALEPGDGNAGIEPTLPASPAVSVPEVPAPPDGQASDPVASSLMVAPTLPVADEHFDPAADPLDDLPAVRLAMEQGGHISAGSQSTAKTAQPDSPPTAATAQASGVALAIEPEADTASPGEGGEKAFKGLVEEGLKDLKSTASDTRVDDFANRLAALTQASVPKTVNALPVNQPLAMHQSGWSEEIVNRVMYLSSANLKSADIQLEPAELGRLDIRVNIAADQSAQVNFASGHAGVREALDSQLHRLREMLAQHGMTQVDVNVSDQSRQWQGQGQDPQAQARTPGSRVDGGGDDEAAPAPIIAPSVVLGSSAVDYYA